MPDKYHIKDPSRFRRGGPRHRQTWRGGLARRLRRGAIDCVKKACVYDRYRQESEYIHNLTEVEALFFDCMGCLFCVQDCTRASFACPSIPNTKSSGTVYWKPDIHQNHLAPGRDRENSRVRRRLRGPFPATVSMPMWTDMSEIVRPPATAFMDANTSARRWTLAGSLRICR